MDYNLSVIDRMTERFVTYIDSGFGLLQPDVAYLTTILVTLDIVLAGLFRALLNDQYMPINTIQKTLYIGFFAFILNNYQTLANLIYLSFAQLGVKAGQATFSADKLLKPAFIAETGMTLGVSLIKEAGEQFFSWSFEASKISAVILFFAGLFVMVTFLILAVHIFVALIEFKLTTLIGFILVPFALFKKTTFLADRVLNNVVNSGLKLMILGIITGIGSSIFQTLTLSDKDITLEEAASAVLASLAILILSFSITRLSQAMVLGTPMLDTSPVVQAQRTIQTMANTTTQTVQTATRAAADVTRPLYHSSASTPQETATAGSLAESHSLHTDLETKQSTTNNTKGPKA